MSALTRSIDDPHTSFSIDGEPRRRLRERAPRHEGDGNFGPQVDYLVMAGFNSHAAAIGDVDSDGNADVVIANRDSEMVSGIGPEKLDYPVLAELSLKWLAVGDLDGDERSDLVFSPDKDTVSVILNTCP